ncbi:MAG: thioredoxin family protein, partial [Crocinitomicaceae bacterium]|nr:thioredoxin family protein [Crocinitomicaceae bacterium]
PFIQKMVEYSPNIELEIQHRDGEGSEINQYLTNGGKSIPKLIVRDENGNDLYNWGPRPTEPQAIIVNPKNSDLTSKEKKSELQVWHNKDKGVSVQKELAELMMTR